MESDKNLDVDKNAKEDESQKSPVQFQISTEPSEMAEPEAEPENSSEPTVETPMLSSEGARANGKVKYNIGDMEVVEVVSRHTMMIPLEIW